MSNRDRAINLQGDLECISYLALDENSGFTVRWKEHIYHPGDREQLKQFTQRCIDEHTNE